MLPRSSFVTDGRKAGERMTPFLFGFSNKAHLSLLLQHLAKIKTKERSWTMRATAQRSPSRPSWDPPYGTKPFPMTEIRSSWNTWTWRNSCRKMASPPVHRNMTTALTLLGYSQLHPLLLPSWTSAAGPLRPSTLASHLRTVCRVLSDQVNSGKCTF